MHITRFLTCALALSLSSCGLPLGQKLLEMEVAHGGDVALVTNFAVSDGSSVDEMWDAACDVPIAAEVFGTAAPSLAGDRLNVELSGAVDVRITHVQSLETSATIVGATLVRTLSTSDDWRLSADDVARVKAAVASVPTTLPAEASDYVLTFRDEFTGTELDATVWRPRSLGVRKNGIVVEEAARLNGEGQLKMTLSRVGDEYHIAQVSTQETFSQTFGYFECRARVNRELGAHTAFWLQSPALSKGTDEPARFGTEIDIFEYHINEGRSGVYHNLHWNGYGVDHKQAGTKVDVPGIDEGFHTFGLLWTEDAYVFYVDGEETWRTTDAVSHIPEYMILSVELSGWGGDVTQAALPDEILFDYVRVYAAP